MSNRSGYFLSGVAALAVTAIALQPCHAAGVEDFYKGKSITLVIGYSAGGGFDLYARLLGRHIGRHIPGQPTVVPQNMPGAGSLRAANYLYSVARPDGTAFGTFSHGLSINPLFVPDTAFDGRKFTWLGSIASDTGLCLTGAASPVKTWNDLLTTQVAMGGTGAGGDPDKFALLYKNVLGAKIKLVTGYPGTNDVALALQRGEVDGLCGYSWSTLKASRPEWVRDRSVHFLVQAGLKKEAALPDVPLATDLTDDPEKKRILSLIIGTQGMFRPIAAPPAIPEDRKAALIKAFDETVKDPAFLADAEKMKVDVAPITAAEIDALLERLYATPKEVVAKAAKAIVE